MGRRSKKQAQRNSLKTSGSTNKVSPETFRPVDPTPLRLFWIGALLIAAATIGVYWNTLENTFVTWDDRDYIYSNPLLERGLGAIWGDVIAEKPHEQYYPMVFTSFWVEYQFVKLDPWLYHLNQMVLHAINAVLLVFVLRSLGVRLFPALVAGALFALHPINVASVAWTTERKNTLSMFFIFLALLFYIQHRRRGHIWPYPTAIVLYVLGLLSKTVTVLLAPILVVTDRVLDGRWTWKSVARILPFLFFGLLMIRTTALIEHRQAKSRDPVDPVMRVPVAAAAITHYVSKFVAPVNLVPIYPRWPVDPSVNLFDLRYVVSLIALLVAAMLAWCYRRKLSVFVFWGAAFFLLAILPMLGFKYFNFLQFSFVSDHFVYHATPGFFLLVGLLLDRLCGKNRASASTGDNATTSDAQASPSAGRAMAVYLVTVGMLVICSWLTFQQNKVWKNGITFWEHTLTCNPDCFPGQWNLGNHYTRQHDYATALSYYREAARILDTHVWSRQYCARCCKELGRPDEALMYYQDAIDVAAKTKRFALDVRLEYAKYLSQLGKLQEAQVEYAKILKQRPHHKEAAMATRNLQNKIDRLK